MPDTKTYTGSCHCGAVAFSCLTPPITSALACNCSHCQIKGMLLTFIPRTDFTLRSGEDHLTDYLFNKKKITHQFCNICGVQPFAHAKDGHGNDTVAINIRCISEIDLDQITTNPFNGKDF